MSRSSVILALIVFAASAAQAGEQKPGVKPRPVPAVDWGKFEESQRKQQQPSGQPTDPRQGTPQIDPKKLPRWRPPGTLQQAGSCEARMQARAEARARELGTPSGPRVGNPDGQGLRQEYARGFVYCHPRTGARVIRKGPFWARWGWAGHERGALGYPVSDEVASPDGGAQQRFEGGRIYYHPRLVRNDLDPRSGAHIVWPGPIDAKWGDHRRESGYLGYPMEERAPNPVGGGRRQRFERGYIYWSEATGAHEVHGAILAKWRDLGWERGLGYPTSDEVPWAGKPGGRQSHFQAGTIFWSPETGAFASTESGEPARRCSQEVKERVLLPATSEEWNAKIDCDLVLDARDVVTKVLILEGAAASGVTVDCAGAMIDGRPGIASANRFMLQVRSHRNRDGTWSRPEDVTIQNCTIYGSVHVWGMGWNANEEHVRASSRSAGHTARVQAAAPTRIALRRLKIIAQGKSALYLSAGVTHSTLEDSEIMGVSNAVAIYLEAESGHNVIRNNDIRVDTNQNDREQLAIDGSAHNLVAGNRFARLGNGGIFLYRNCGEKGSIRHQTPSHNRIIDNVFYYNRYTGANPSVHIASRNGDRPYCDKDDGYPFGSSASNRDWARFNVVARNRIYKRRVTAMIRADETPNFVFANETVTSASDRPSGCHLDGGYPRAFLEHGQHTDLRVMAGSVRCDGRRYTCHDGRIEESPVRCASLAVDRREFGCRVTADNAGCSSSRACPAGQRIAAVRAACNLEQGAVARSVLEQVPLGWLAIDRAPDTFGSCHVDDVEISAGAVDLGALDGRSRVRFGCRETDDNGGDCHILGEIYCR